MVVIALTKWLSKILHTKYKYLGISAISWNCLQITNSSININWPHNLCVLFWRFFSYIKILTKYVPSWKTCRHCYCDMLTASLFAHELQSHLKKNLENPWIVWVGGFFERNKLFYVNELRHFFMKHSALREECCLMVRMTLAIVNLKSFKSFF